MGITLRLPRQCHDNGLFKYWLNQSDENAGIAFVKVAKERNEVFEKINKQ